MVTDLFAESGKPCVSGSEGRLNCSGISDLELPLPHHTLFLHSTTTDLLWGQGSIQVAGVQLSSAGKVRSHHLEITQVPVDEKPIYKDLAILVGGVEGWIFTTMLSFKRHREAARAAATSLVVRSPLNERNFGSACNNGL